MNLPSAEMVKYASNVFLATKISFINEIANICERIPGVDVVKVAEGMGLDPRIGRHSLNAGLGFGGSCFPKDIKALISFAKSLGYKPKIISETLLINYRQALRGVEPAKELLGELKGKVIAILGLSFKPNTSDMRETSSLKIIDRLLKEGAKIKVYDPAALDEAKKILGDKVVYAKSVVEAIKNADCCIIVTEWDEFRRLTPEDFIHNMKNPAIVDGRRIFNPVSKVTLGL
jgi:UDPglucose 6-dehydrogenase